MIRVDIRRQSDTLISGFTVTGHADYKNLGEDVVCAGVSAVTTGTVNAVEALLQVDMNPIARSGYLHADVPVLEDLEKFNQTQLLLESMIVMLQGIESSYSKYITIQVTII